MNRAPTRITGGGASDSGRSWPGGGPVAGHPTGDGGELGENEQFGEEGAGGDVVGEVLAAQWAAAQVAGGVPIRFRDLPRPFVEESLLTVSFSGVEAYRTCPRQFFYGHVLGVGDGLRGASATLGSRVHSALLALNTGWMETGRPPEDAEVRDAWRMAWPIDGETVEAALINPETRVRWGGGFVFARQVVQAWQRGGKYLRRYYQWERERWPGTERRPVAMERRFEFEHNGHQINGRIDCVMRSSGGDLVLDYKTGKPHADLKAKRSLQLAIYERAWELETGIAPAVAYYFMANEGDKGDQAVPWDSGKQVNGAKYDGAAREELWGEIDGALGKIAMNMFAAAPVKGAGTCGVCAYSLWCEESLA